MCERLGLTPVPATQVLPRDRHAEVLYACASIGASVESFALEIRHLQRTEVREAEEAFREGEQKGSSAMPHKRNPIKSEQLCGLARVLRGNLQAALEDVALWHERDISHSSVERIIVPDSLMLAYYVIVQFTKVVAGLRVYPERMLRNLDASFGLVFSQPVLLALVEAGASRDDAYRIVQRNAMRAWQEERSFRELLVADPEVRAVLDDARLDACFDLEARARQRRPHLRRARPDRGDAAVEPRWRSYHRVAARLLGQGPRALRGRPRPAARWSRATACRCSTSCSPTRSPTRAACSPACRSTGSTRPPTSSRNHVISCDPTDFPETAGDVGGRAMLVRATRPIRLECVVRGYLFGSGWKEYTERGTVGGFAVPAGLQQAERLPEPLFTPTTKAESGHDLPLTASEAAELVGADVYEQLRDLSIRIYDAGRGARATSSGLVLADTKFEFGELDGEIIVIDEMMTPDSSRYWPLDAYQVGTSPPSFDKQFVRDFMDSTGWNHEPPAPRMPAEVIDATRGLYREAYELLTGSSLDDWYGPDE